MKPKRKELMRQIGELKCLLLDQQRHINQLERQQTITEEYKRNSNRNREWCDNASNFIGPWAHREGKKMDNFLVQCLNLRADLLEISNGYHTVDGKYPWEVTQEEE